MRRVYEDIRSAGGELLVVTQAKPESLAPFARLQNHPFPVAGDPELNGYKAFELGRASLLGFLKPWVIWGYLRIIFRGWLPRLPAADADIHQLGGDFVLDRAGLLTYAYPSRNPTDRPTPETLLQAVRAAAGKTEAAS